MKKVKLPERITDTHVYFWSSLYSNWYSSPFNIDGNHFKNSEAAYMYQKAMYFNDTYRANIILDSNQNPKYAKSQGRIVEGYNDEEWSKVRKEIMTAVIFEKFAQSPQLLDVLISHKNHHIVEASPYDTIWGVGLHWSDDEILNEGNWKGQNLLGESLMDVQRQFDLRN